MDDSLRLREGKCLGDVAEDAHGLPDRQRPRREARSQCVALHERHHVVWQSGDFTGRQHRDDVRVLQPRRKLYLTMEPVGADADGEFGVQDLDDDRALQSDVFGQEHARHPAATELTGDRVARAERSLQGAEEIVVQSSLYGRREGGGVALQKIGLRPAPRQRNPPGYPHCSPAGPRRRVARSARLGRHA